MESPFQFRLDSNHSKNSVELVSRRVVQRNICSPRSGSGPSSCGGFPVGNGRRYWRPLRASGADTGDPMHHKPSSSRGGADTGNFYFQGICFRIRARTTVRFRIAASRVLGALREDIRASSAKPEPVRTDGCGRWETPKSPACRREKEHTASRCRWHCRDADGWQNPAVCGRVRVAESLGRSDCIKGSPAQCLSAQGLQREVLSEWCSERY